MLRKIITSAIVICATSALIAQTTPSLPKDADTLRKAYQEARQRALQPLDLKYRTELEKLMAAHTKAGRLDDALAIRTELDLLSASTKSSPTTESATNPLPALAVGKWHWTHTTYDKATVFKEDGTFENVWFKGTWELKGRKLHLKFQNASTGQQRVDTKFEANEKTGAYEGPDGLGANVILRPPKQ